MHAAVETRGLSGVYAALLLVLLVVVSAALLYLAATGVVPASGPPLAERLQGLARIEALGYYETASGEPILVVYARNLGETSLTPDTVYLEGSLIRGHPRKYVYVTARERLHYTTAATASISLGKAAENTTYWSTAVSGLTLTGVWGGDTWAIDVAAGTASRVSTGLITVGAELEWQPVKTWNARGGCSRAGDLVYCTCRSTNGWWAAASLRARLPSPLQPPFVLELWVSKDTPEVAGSNAGAYLTPTASTTNPYNEIPFYQAGVFYWYTDVVELRVRNSTGYWVFYSTDVEASQARAILVVEEPGRGVVEAYESSTDYGSTAFAAAGMDSSMRYLWLTLETRNDTTTAHASFNLTSLKLYKSPGFTILVQGLGGYAKYYNLTLRAGEAVVSYLLPAGAPVHVDPWDSHSLYTMWLRSGYPADYTVDISVLWETPVTVEALLGLEVVLGDVIVEVVGAPPDYDPSKLALEASVVDVGAVWSLRELAVSGGQVEARIAIVVYNATVDLRVLYDGGVVAVERVVIPIYEVVEASATGPLAPGEPASLVVPASMHMSYNRPVYVEATLASPGGPGVAEDTLVLRGLASSTVTVDLWAEHTIEVGLGGVYGGDAYSIAWTGGGWEATRTASGLVLREEFDPGWQSRWTLRWESEVYASKYGSGGWGGIRAKRTGNTVYYPAASLLKSIPAGDTVVVEGLAKKGYYGRTEHYTGVFLGDAWTTNPWYSNNYVMVRIAPDGGVQVGVKTGAERRWSTKLYTTGHSTAFTLVVEGGRLEYWLWPSTTRSAEPAHGVMTGAPSPSTLDVIYLTHTYYGRVGSTYYYRYSLFDNITVYRGTRIGITVDGGGDARAYQAILLTASGAKLHTWLLPGNGTITLDLRDWYLRGYWLSQGCPLPLKLRIIGENRVPTPVTVIVDANVTVRLYANLTITSYDPELAGRGVELRARLVGASIVVESIEARAVGEMVLANAMLRVDSVTARVELLVGGEPVYEETITIPVGERVSAVAAKKASPGAPVEVRVAALVRVEEDVTDRLPNGGVVEVGEKEDALRIPPGEAKRVEFVLEEKPRRGHRYLVRLVFREGVEAARYYTIP